MKRVKIQGYIVEDLKKWVEEMVEKGVFRSEAHAVEEGLNLKKLELTGKLLAK